MAFRAQFPGRCKACGMPFSVGTRLTGARGNWRHADCGERRVTPGMGFTQAPARPVAPAPVRATEPDRLAASVNAETQRVPTAPRETPAWVASMSALPDAVAERARAEAARVARAAEFQARGRVLPPRAPRGEPVERTLTPDEQRAARFRGLELDSGSVRLASVISDVFDGPTPVVGFTPTPEPEDEGLARFRGLELD